MDIQNYILDYFENINVRMKGRYTADYMNEQNSTKYKESLKEYRKKKTLYETKMMDYNRNMKLYESEKEKYLNDKKLYESLQSSIKPTPPTPPSKPRNPKKPVKPAREEMNRGSDILLEKIEYKGDKLVARRISLQEIIQHELKEPLQQEVAIELITDNELHINESTGEEFFIEKCTGVTVYFINENDVLSKVTIPMKDNDEKLFEEGYMINRTTSNIHDFSVLEMDDDLETKRKIMWEDKRPTV